jgi:hypothetical protein
MKTSFRPHKKNERLKRGVPSGIRTRVAAVKGRCPRPLDDGDLVVKKVYPLEKLKSRDFCARK